MCQLIFFLVLDLCGDGIFICWFVIELIFQDCYNVKLDILMFGYVINEIFIYGCEFFMDYYSFIMDDIIVGVLMILWYLIYLKIRFMMFQ